MQQHPATSLRRRAPSTAASALHTPTSKKMTPVSESPDRTTRSRQTAALPSAAPSSATAAREESPASTQEVENQQLDSNINAQQTMQANAKQSEVTSSAHVPALPAASASASAPAVLATPKSTRKKRTRMIVPEFLGPATPSKNVDALPFNVAAAAAAAADQAAQQRLMLQQFSSGSNFGSGLSLEEEFNMVASSAPDDLSLLSSHPPLAAFQSPQRPLAYTPLRTPLHPVTSFTNNAHAASATSASVASNAAASVPSTTAPAPAAPSLRSKQKLSFAAASSSSGAAAAASASAPFKMALPDTYLKVLAGATNAFASSYPSAARAAARASASAAAASSSASASPPAPSSSSSILSPFAASAAASSGSTWSNFNFSLHSFASTTSQPNQSEACNQLFASSAANSAVPSIADAPAPATVRPLDEAQLKELVQKSLEQAGIESDVENDEDEADASMHDAAAAAPGLFGAPLPYAPESFTGPLVWAARNNRAGPALFATPERSTTKAAAAASAAPASEPQLVRPSSSTEASPVPSAPSSAPAAKSKRPRTAKIAPVHVPGFPVPFTTKRGVAALARQAAAAHRPPKPESLKVKRRKKPQFVNNALQLVVDVHQAREKTDTLEAGMGLEMLTHGLLAPAHTPSVIASAPVAPSSAAIGPMDLTASAYPLVFRGRATQTAPAAVPGCFTAAQRTELRSQVQLHMQLLFQTHWLCSMLPTPPPAKMREARGVAPTPHAALAPITRAMIEQMVNAAQGTTSSSAVPAAAAAATAATAASAPALSVSPESSVQGDADEHAERLMLLMNASTASPKSSASVSDDATDDDEQSSKSAAGPAISLAAVGPYARTTPLALSATTQGPLKVLQVPAMSLWPREDSLRNLTFPEGPEAEQRKMEVIEEAWEAEKGHQPKTVATAAAAAAAGDKDEAMQDSAMGASKVAAATATLTAAAAAASSSSPSAPAAFFSPAASKRSAVPASASSSGSKQPRYLQLLPQSLVQSFWSPFLNRQSPDAGVASVGSAAASSKSSASAPNCYALDDKFFVRYLRHERHTFSTAEEHLWKLGLASHSWGTLKAKLLARKDFQETLAAAVQVSTATHISPNSGRRTDPNRRKLSALLSSEDATMTMLQLIRRRFMPGKSLDQLHSKLLMQFINEKKAMAIQPRMLIMPPLGNEAAGSKATTKAALTATGLPRAFRPMPSQIAAAVEQDAQPLEGFVIRRTLEEGEEPAAGLPGQAGAAAAAAASVSSPFAPVLTLRDLTSTELLVVTKGLELHGAHRNKWSLISTQMLPYFPRKLLAKAWTKHQARLKGGKPMAKPAAAAAASQPGSPSSAASQKKPRAVGGKKRKTLADDSAVFDTMDLSAAPAQATPAERRRVEGDADAASSAEDFDTMEFSMDAEDQVEETSAQTALHPAAAMLSPQQTSSIKVPVGFTPAKPDQTSNQLAA